VTFVLRSWSEPCLTASLRMEINNAKLLKFLEAINGNLLWLIMQLIGLSEAVTARLPAEAQPSPKIAEQYHSGLADAAAPEI
jgi:hypothetical protein